MRTKISASLATFAFALAVPSTASADEMTGGIAASASTASAEADTDSDADPKRTILPMVVGGLGAAQLVTGVILLAAAPSMPDNCIEATRTCTRLPGQSEESFRKDQQDAGDSAQMDAFGKIAVTSGAVFLVAGAAMYFWYRRDPASTAATRPVVVPYAGTSGGGLAAVATF